MYKTNEVVVNIRKCSAKGSSDSVLVTFSDLDDILAEYVQITVDNVFKYYQLDGQYTIDTVEDLNILIQFIREYFEENINLDYHNQLQSM
jgi:hypothetical protein